MGLAQENLSQRGAIPFTRHIHPFDIPVPTSTLSNQLNTDKGLLRQQILKMHQLGMSYRQIGTVVELHWTRVGQIVKNNPSLLHLMLTGELAETASACWLKDNCRGCQWVILLKLPIAKDVHLLQRMSGFASSLQVAYSVQARMLIVPSHMRVNGRFRAGTALV